LSVLDAERTFNLIDHIFIDDSLRDAELGGNLILIRGKLNKIYDREHKRSSSAEDEFQPSGNGPIDYTEQSENGFVGLEAPLG
jgi:hypothetical protein